MTTTEELATFTQEVSYDDLSNETVDAIKKRILDAVGIAMGAIDHEPVQRLFRTVCALDEDGTCSLWGSPHATSPVQATMYNTALVRYLDYMDSFLAPGETPHPSDNIAAAIVCGSYNEKMSEELIEAIGVAYEVQAQLAWNAPVRDRGWDHVTHTVLSATCAAGKLLDLSHEELRNAIGIAGTAHNALRVTRTGKISMWKGFASANAARNAVYACLLAKHGIRGPVDLFEGEKGWEHIISGAFDCDFNRGCESVHKTMTKKYVAETYAQSAVEGIIELVERENIDADNIEEIHLKTFHGAYQIIGGGEGGDRYAVEEKEQADHSLPYMLAVAVLDGTVMNEQYERERIQQDDVQTLLRKVTVEESEELTERFENGEMPAMLTITTEDGAEHTIEKRDFDGHPNNPASWEVVENKFRELSHDQLADGQQDAVIDLVQNIEGEGVGDLEALLV